MQKVKKGDHYLQHASFEGLGSIEPWLKSSGYHISNTRLFEGEQLPDLEEISFLVIMGGPMSVNDEDELPWLVQEKDFIRGAVETGKPVLGVCLGAQLIASALGARVYSNTIKEIGWFQVQGLLSHDPATFCFPQAVEVFQWHGETFDLPQQAVHLARNLNCENQAFQIGETVIGMQFHLETTPRSAQQIVSHCKAELIPSATIQSKTEILSISERKYRTVNNLMKEILTYLTGKTPLVELKKEFATQC